MQPQKVPNINSFTFFQFSVIAARHSSFYNKIIISQKLIFSQQFRHSQYFTLRGICDAIANFFQREIITIILNLKNSAFFLAVLLCNHESS